jgi:hypothetical protein
MVDREEEIRDWLELEVVDADILRLAEGVEDVERPRLILLIEVDLAKIRSSLWVLEDPSRSMLDDEGYWEIPLDIEGTRREEYKLPAARPRLALLRS